MKLTARGGEGMFLFFAAKRLQEMREAVVFFLCCCLVFRAWNTIRKAYDSEGSVCKFSNVEPRLERVSSARGTWRLTETKKKKLQRAALKAAESQDSWMDEFEWGSFFFFSTLFFIMTVCFHKIIICVIPASLKVVACLISAEWSTDISNFKK